MDLDRVARDQTAHTGQPFLSLGARRAWGSLFYQRSLPASPPPPIPLPQDRRGSTCASSPGSTALNLLGLHFAFPRHGFLFSAPPPPPSYCPCVPGERSHPSTCGADPDSASLCSVLVPCINPPAPWTAVFFNTLPRDRSASRGPWEMAYTGNRRPRDKGK